MIPRSVALRRRPDRRNRYPLQSAFGRADGRLLGCLYDITAEGKYVHIHGGRYTELVMPDRRDLAVLVRAVTRYSQENNGTIKGEWMRYLSELYSATVARNAGKGALALCLLMLAGCGGSPEDKVYTAFKCSKVAVLLEREKDGDMAAANAIPHMKEMEAGWKNPALVALEMNQRFQDDVPLYRLTVGSQMALLTKIHQSDECQALYRPVEGLTQAGDINLAGCNVPPGLTPAEAENVQCSKTDPVAGPEIGVAEDTAAEEAALMAAEAAASSAAAAAAVAAGSAAPAAPEPQRSTTSPSFDCTVAASPVEHMICTSDRLADLDNRMASQYMQMTRNFGVVPKLIASQRDWISQRNACTDAKCVEEAYYDRLGVLANVRVYGSGDVEGL